MGQLFLSKHYRLKGDNMLCDFLSFCSAKVSSLICKLEPCRCSTTHYFTFGGLFTYLAIYTSMMDRVSYPLLWLDNKKNLLFLLIFFFKVYNLTKGEQTTYVPKKITIGLSAWVTFKVVSKSRYNFMWWKYDYFSTFQWRPHLIWSSNHKEIWIFVKQVTGPFVPSFAIRMYMAFTDTLRSQHTDLQTFKIVCIPFQQRLILTT